MTPPEVDGCSITQASLLGRCRCTVPSARRTVSESRWSLLAITAPRQLHTPVMLPRDAVTRTRASGCDGCPGGPGATALHQLAGSELASQPSSCAPPLLVALELRRTSTAFGSRLVPERNAKPSSRADAPSIAAG